MTTNSADDNGDPPLWQYVAISDYEHPTASVRTISENWLLSLKRWWQPEEPEEEPFTDIKELGQLSSEQLALVAPPPDWQEAATTLLDKLDDWLAAEEPDPPVIFLVAPPHSDYAHILTLLAEEKEWSVIQPPTLDEIDAGDPALLLEQMLADKVWLFPYLERAFLRHRGGLTLIRRFLQQVYAGDCRERGLICCDSWAWAYLQYVWPHRLFGAVTLQAFDQQRLARFFQLQADAAGKRKIAFRESDNGRYVFTPPTDSENDPAETSEFLEKLATHSRGILGIAWAIWRDSLQTRPDDVLAESLPDDQEDHSDVTLWLKAWEQINKPALPEGAGHDYAFILHALLLHKGLTADLLIELLPLTFNQVMELLFVLQASGIVIKSDQIWYITPIGYPAVRQFLEGHGYLVDSF